jgi:hypothetical protein
MSGEKDPRGPVDWDPREDPRPVIQWVIFLGFLFWVSIAFAWLLR